MINTDMINTKRFEKLLYLNQEICDQLVREFLESDYDFSLVIIDKYKLNYLEDIYIKGINASTYNGYKRRLLRLQALKFIELMNFASKIIDVCQGKSIDADDLYKLVEICE